ncbi:Adenylate kinase [uncultured archaeon]|nr:Adenylate kinase [uncultured archaeon]
MAKIFLVLGTPGAGKSTVLKGVKAADVLSIGTEMLNAYAEQLGVTDRDALKKVVVADYANTAAIRNSVLKSISGRSGVVVLDTHASVKAGNGYIPGLSPEDLVVLKKGTKAIIYIDAETNEIIRRRKEDKSRAREDDTAEVLDQHREINIALTTTYSLYLEAPIYILKNGDGNLESTRKEVARIIDLFSK